MYSFKFPGKRRVFQIREDSRSRIGDVSMSGSSEAAATPPSTAVDVAKGKQYICSFKKGSDTRFGFANQPQDTSTLGVTSLVVSILTYKEETFADGKRYESTYLCVCKHRRREYMCACIFAERVSRSCPWTLLTQQQVNSGRFLHFDD